MTGCNANAWLADPGAVGYYKPTPTTIPILDRIDIIEEPSVWPQLSEVTAADLIPSDLTYRIAAGDILDVAIYGLYGSGQFFPVQRMVDQGGFFRVPEVGDVPVAGLTPQSAQDLITDALTRKAMTHPSVQVDVFNQTGFTYTIYGGLARWGVFTLRNPNLLLLEALAQAGGVPQSIKNIYVIRQLPLSDTVLPTWDHRTSDNLQNSDSGDTRGGKTPLNGDAIPNIEDLINQLNLGGASTEPAGQEIPEPQDPLDQQAPNTVPDVVEPLSIPDTNRTTEEIAPPVSPGILQVGDGELIDIDDLVPAQVGERTLVDVDEISQPTPPSTDYSSAYIYIPQSDTWVPVSTDPSIRIPEIGDSTDSYKKASPMLERIIIIPWNRLAKGDSTYNIVIRPDDRIYVEPPMIGNLYIRGEVGRPGVYDYPVTGDRITLSEFITAAGDLGPIAVPEKVSLTRRISENVEATVTLNYAAILQRTEPDIFLKPNDHISIGTSWGSTPLAIIRNGFRATYGFGFLLDRNFGNDVFGAPPRF